MNFNAFDMKFRDSGEAFKYESHVDDLKSVFCAYQSNDSSLNIVPAMFGHLVWIASRKDQAPKSNAVYNVTMVSKFPTYVGQPVWKQY